MVSVSENLKRDIMAARARVKETRENLGRDVEKRAKAAGKSVQDFSRETYDRMEHSLEDISEKISSGGYKLGEDLKESASGVYDELYNVHKMVRAFRREITGGVVEDQAVDVLKTVEIKLSEILNRLRDDEYGIIHREKKRPAVKKIKKRRKF
jgi:gas vesicle protein